VSKKGIRGPLPRGCGKEEHLRTRYLSFISVQALNQMSLVIISLFLPLFLSQQGLGQAAIGTLIALSPLIAIVAQPVWGTAADRSRSKPRVLMVLFLGAGVSGLLFYVPGGFLPILAVITLFTFFQIGIEPLLTSITLEHALERGWRFGPIRMAGTVGFAVMAVVAGYILNDGVRLSFVLYFMLCVLGCLAVLTLPRVEGHQTRQNRTSMLALLRNRELRRLLVFAAVLMSTLFFYYTFFPLHYRALGATPLLLGWSTFVSAIPEVAVLVFADRLVRRIGARNVLFIAGTALALRWFLFYVLDNPYAILPVQLLHSLSFILIFFAVSYHIGATVPAELRASGQALYGLVVAGGAKVVGSFFGGLLSERFGIRTIFLCNGIIVVIAVLAFASLALRQRQRQPRRRAEAG
jgi:PPP family 3-phenylpropionic acid transporter